jgi:histidinol dehydrogenase
MKVIKYSPRAWKKLQAIFSPPADAAALARVRAIIDRVRREGDRALRDYTLKYDGARIRSFRVAPAKIAAARKNLPADVRRAFRRAERNISLYYSSQLPRSWKKARGDGLVFGEKVTPLEAVGVYIPGGKAPLVSTVFMTVIPARIAGVERIVLATPPRKDGTIDPFILAAADFLGVREIYALGGAQAIAALAYGTRSVPRVDKVAGPGNVYVTLAKREVFGAVDIDMLAGPSEVAVLADDSAEARFVAADLLAQAEHGAGGMALLVTPSARLIEKVKKEIAGILPGLRRWAILQDSLEKGTLLIKTRNLGEGTDLINRIAPEHLEILTRDPGKTLRSIRNAGAIFLGRDSPVAAGDYIAGPSHVLPTGGSARFFSHLSVYDFVKRTSVIAYTRAGLKRDAAAAAVLSGLEGLDAHSLSVRIRLGNPGPQSSLAPRR